MKEQPSDSPAIHHDFLQIGSPLLPQAPQGCPATVCVVDDATSWTIPRMIELGKSDYCIYIYMYIINIIYIYTYIYTYKNNRYLHIIYICLKEYKRVQITVTELSYKTPSRLNVRVIRCHGCTLWKSNLAMEGEQTVHDFRVRYQDFDCPRYFNSFISVQCILQVCDF